MNLKAAESTSEEKSSEKSKSLGVGVTVGVGITGIGVSAGINGSKSKANSEGESKSYTNTKIIAGRSADLTSGRDTNLKGTRVEAEELAVNVGRNLNIESVQNTNRYKSSSKGASFGLSTSLGGWNSGINITPDNLLNNALNNGDGLPVIGKSGVYGPGGSSWNLGINGSKGKGEFAWAQEQSGLVGENKVDVTVGENTDLKGGVIASKSKELTLDTGTLTFSDLADKDKSKNVGGSISVGGPLSGGGNESEGKIGGAGDLSVTVEGQYAKKDKEGVTRATVGEGEITIRDTEKQKELEESGQTQKLANLNRDLDKAQEVTKDEETEINLYVSSSSLKTLKKIGEAAANAIDNLVNEGKLSAESGERVKSVLEALEDVDPESLALCSGGGSQGFNWHDFIFTKAYAADLGCLIRFGGDNLTQLSEEEYAALRKTIVEEAEKKIKEILPRIQELVQLEKAGLLNENDPLKEELKHGRYLLTQQMSYFELCSDNPGALRSASWFPSDSSFNNILYTAEAFRISADSYAKKSGLYGFAGAGGSKTIQESVEDLRKIFKGNEKASELTDQYLDAAISIHSIHNINLEDLTDEQRSKALRNLGRGLANAYGKLTRELRNNGGYLTEDGRTADYTAKYLTYGIDQVIVGPILSDLSREDFNEISIGAAQAIGRELYPQALTELTAVIAGVAMVSPVRNIGQIRVSRRVDGDKNWFENPQTNVDSEAGIIAGRVKFDGTPEPHERLIGQELADQGLDVKIRGKNVEGPDALIGTGSVNAKYWEIKKVTGTSDAALYDNARNAVKQFGNQGASQLGLTKADSRVLIDVRGNSRWDNPAEVQEELRSRARYFSSKGTKEIKVITSDGPVSWRPE